MLFNEYSKAVRYFTVIINVIDKVIFKMLVCLCRSGNASHQ